MKKWCASAHESAHNDLLYITTHIRYFMPKALRSYAWQVYMAGVLLLLSSTVLIESSCSACGTPAMAPSAEIISLSAEAVSTDAASCTARCTAHDKICVWGVFKDTGTDSRVCKEGVIRYSINSWSFSGSASEIHINQRDW